MFRRTSASSHALSAVLALIVLGAAPKIGPTQADGFTITGTWLKLPCTYRLALLRNSSRPDRRIQMSTAPHGSEYSGGTFEPW